MIGIESFNNFRVLYFKNFAYELQSNDIDTLLKRLGAVNTLVFPSCSPNAKHRALAEFKSSEDCWKIIKSLHQRELCGVRLAIEFGNYNHRNPPSSMSVPSNETTPESHNFPRWIEKLTTLSDKWLPGHSLPDVFYSYPTATTEILTNIVRCLASVPAFYVQTLHLMNRLNLPAPFCDSNEFPGSLLVLTNEEVKMCGAKGKVEEMEVSSGSESEISDDSIGDQVRSHPSSLEPKAIRKPSKLKSGILKLQKRRFDFRGKALRPTPVVAFNSEKMSSSPKPELSDEPVFEKTQLRSTPLIKLQINDVAPPTSNSQSDVDAQTEGFGVFSTEERTSNPQSIASPVEDRSAIIPSTRSEVVEISNDDDDDDEFLKKPPPLMREELAAGKVPDDELNSNPVFAKSPGPGAPSSRLYVKNLHKKTTDDDLWLVFGSFHRAYRRRAKDGPNQFSIQILTSGRMRGQAFIALDSIEVATEALNATHGYVLNGKPMHVQFARGVLAKPDSNSLINEPN
ncbi:unnamed protein product [Rodentolepis nana]|uniref:RRM domain-containing protein n=1 Tax=Rodentolepis nana TaxID=102285 RepID=A0A0R3TN76_RODNA|nr:unnamed protein product [Rodentolepis nana]